MPGPGATGSLGKGCPVASGRQRGQVRLDLAIAGVDLAMIELIQLHGLPQREEVLSPPIALERLGDGRLVTAAAGIAESGQAGQITLAAEDGLDDGQAGLAGDVADDLGELEVHQLKGLLHVLDVVADEGHEHLPLPQVAAEDDDLVLGAKRGGEQPAGVEPLEPLAVVDVALGAALQAAGLAGIDDADGEAAGLQQLERKPLSVG